MEQLMEMTEALVTFQDLSFRWQKSEAFLFEGLSWQLPAGGAVFLEAPSGGGKTTFLRLAAGLIRPTSGSVVCGTRRIGFAFQESRLFPWLTVRENILFAQRRPDLARISALLAAVGLSELAEQKATVLSGGEAQRVNFLRALASSPDLLLLDEPFSGLDAVAAEKCAGVLREWKEGAKHRGMILATHQPQYAGLCGATPFALGKS